MDRIVILLILSFGLLPSFAIAGDSLFPARKYICPPCPHVDSLFDGEKYAHDGHCPICGMSLVEAPDMSVDKGARLHEGSGSFLMDSSVVHPNKPVPVFYHKPKTFSKISRILIVLPGAGRNAWDYRDAWIDAAEKHDVLILAPYYDETVFEFADYHLAGVVSALALHPYKTQASKGRVNKYYVKDEDIKIGAPTMPERWLFRDFDLMFETVSKELESSRSGYDIFGHSAGGQILHRMAIFYPQSKAETIVAANSGFYTVPDGTISFPFGVGNTHLDKTQLSQSFSKKLILLLGENDDELETRGTMLHTPYLDRQGPGRLARGKAFFEASKALAAQLHAKFEWRVEVVEDVGHDAERMSQAARNILYSQ